jgi:hypothetical protein
MTTTRNTKASNFTPLPQTMHATVNGHPVRCIAYADVEGNSPSYLTIDDQGQSAWTSFSDVTISDPNFLPVGNRALAGSTR